MSCKCEKCEKSCCSRVFAGLSSSAKNADDRFTQILLSPEEAERIKNAGGGQFLAFNEEIGAYYMKIGEDNTCPAFANGRCSIYSSRPDVCRLYPFYFDNFGGLFIHKDCPGDFTRELEENKLEILKLIRNRIDYFENLEKNKK